MYKGLIMSDILKIYDRCYILNGFKHLSASELNEKVGLNWNQYYMSYDSFIKDYENKFLISHDDIQNSNMHPEEVLNRYQIYDNKNKKFIEFSKLNLDSIDEYIKYLKQIEAECKLLQEKIKKASE